MKRAWVPSDWKIEKRPNYKSFLLLLVNKTLITLVYQILYFLQITLYLDKKAK